MNNIINWSESESEWTMEVEGVTKGSFSKLYACVYGWAIMNYHYYDYHPAFHHDIHY